VWLNNKIEERKGIKFVVVLWINLFEKEKIVED